MLSTGPPKEADSLGFEGSSVSPIGIAVLPRSASISCQLTLPWLASCHSSDRDLSWCFDLLRTPPSDGCSSGMPQNPVLPIGMPFDCPAPADPSATIAPYVSAHRNQPPSDSRALY